MTMDVIDTVLLKVASRCNLDCSYCYVYHMGDDGWRYQPKLMPDAVQAAIVRQLADLYASQQHRLHVVLHGGEPLLIGPARMRKLCNALRSALPTPCEVHVQTNGLLLTEAFIDVFVEYDVGSRSASTDPLSCMTSIASITAAADLMTVFAARSPD